MTKLLVVLGISNADASQLDMAKVLPKWALSQTGAATVPTRDITISFIIAEMEGMGVWSSAIKVGEGG